MCRWLRVQGPGCQRLFVTDCCQAREAVLLTRPDVLLLPKCPCVPQTVALGLSHPCFPEFRLSFCSFSYSANIYLVPVVCQTHRKHSGCRHEQDKGPDSRARVLSSCSSFLPSALLALILSPSALFSQGLLQDLSFTVPHPCATMSVAFSCQQGEPPALWPNLWDFDQPAPALAAAIRTLTLCSHYLLTPVQPF